MDGVSCSNSNANSNSKQQRGEKHDPATPDGNDEKFSTHQKQKKPCCAVKVDTAAKEKTDLGMYYFHNTSITPSNVFPKDMPS